MPTKEISASLDLENERMRVGTLQWSGESNLATFEYDPAFLKSGLNISPFNLKPAAGAIAAKPLPFDGLHGAFADSLPDGWGKFLVHRQIIVSGRKLSAMTPLDHLAITGLRGMGALTYEPHESIVAAPTGSLQLYYLARQANRAPIVMIELDQQAAQTMLAASGSAAGAKPKIMILRDPEYGDLRFDTVEIKLDRFEHWLLKLTLKKDGQDTGKVEHAYAQMARAAGIDFPKTILVKDETGISHFAVKRFDRTATGRLHVHSLAGLLDADIRIPSLDYTDFLKVTKILTDDHLQVEEAFRRMVFNILVQNRDDHAKNHAFLMNRTGHWKLSPAYDITHSKGICNQHNMTVAGAGKEPQQEHILKVAQDSGIPPITAKRVIDEVASALVSWPKHAEDAGISAAVTLTIGARIDSQAKITLDLAGLISKASV